VKRSNTPIIQEALTNLTSATKGKSGARAVLVPLCVVYRLLQEWWLRVIPIFRKTKPAVLQK
jgi:hypothetical protein